MVSGTGDVRREQRLQDGLRPEPDLSGPGLEDGVVRRIGERHGDGARLEARLFRGRRVTSFEIDAERKPGGHG